MLCSILLLGCSPFDGGKYLIMSKKSYSIQTVNLKSGGAFEAYYHGSESTLYSQGRWRELPDKTLIIQSECGSDRIWLSNIDTSTSRSDSFCILKIVNPDSYTFYNVISTDTILLQPVDHLETYDEDVFKMRKTATASIYVEAYCYKPVVETIDLSYDSLDLGIMYSKDIRPQKGLFFLNDTFRVYPNKGIVLSHQSSLSKLRHRPIKSIEGINNPYDWKHFFRLAKDIHLGKISLENE